MISWLSKTTPPHFRSDILSVTFFTHMIVQNFVHSLRQYESILFKEISPNYQILKLRTALGISSTSPSSQSVSQKSSPSINSFEWSRMCALLSAYRLLDIVAMQSGANHAPFVDRHALEVANSQFRVSLLLK